MTSNGTEQPNATIDLLYSIIVAADMPPSDSQLCAIEQQIDAALLQQPRPTAKLRECHALLHFTGFACDLHDAVQQRIAAACAKLNKQRLH